MVWYALLHYDDVTVLGISLIYTSSYGEIWNIMWPYLRVQADNYRREVEECRKNLSTSLEANERLAK